MSGEDTVPTSRQRRHSAASAAATKLLHLGLREPLCIHCDSCPSASSGFWADREALHPGAAAPLLLWAALRPPDGGNAPLALAQDVALTVTYTDCDGVDSRQAFRDVKLTGRGQVGMPSMCMLRSCACVQWARRLKMLERPSDIWPAACRSRCHVTPIIKLQQHIERHLMYN